MTCKEGDKCAIWKGLAGMGTRCAPLPACIPLPPAAPPGASHSRSVLQITRSTTPSGAGAARQHGTAGAGSTCPDTWAPTASPPPAAALTCAMRPPRPSSPQQPPPCWAWPLPWVLGCPVPSDPVPSAPHWTQALPPPGSGEGRAPERVTVDSPDWGWGDVVASPW